jgi:hypothetical protein
MNQLVPAYQPCAASPVRVLWNYATMTAHLRYADNPTVLVPVGLRPGWLEGGDECYSHLDVKDWRGPWPSIFAMPHSAVVVACIGGAGAFTKEVWRKSSMHAPWTFVAKSPDSELDVVQPLDKTRIVIITCTRFSIVNIDTGEVVFKTLKVLSKYHEPGNRHLRAPKYVADNVFMCFRGSKTVYVNVVTEEEWPCDLSVPNMCIDWLCDLRMVWIAACLNSAQ